MYQFPNYQLAVFAKSPRLGKAKTRMQPQFPLEFSLALHTQLLDYVLTQWTQTKMCPIDLWLAGCLADFEKQLPHWQALPISFQQGSDLGERMKFATQQSLNTAEGVILVGTDCPFIDSDYLKQACEALQGHDVVIGPAADGGYVLLGLKECHSTLFEDIEWGGPTVYSETIKKIKQQDLSYSVLSKLHDIDRPDDLAALKTIHQFDELLSLFSN